MVKKENAFLQLLVSWAKQRIMKKNQTIWCKIKRFRECHGTVIINSERPPKEITTKMGLNRDVFSGG